MPEKDRSLGVHLVTSDRPGRDVQWERRWTRARDAASFAHAKKAAGRPARTQVLLSVRRQIDGGPLAPLRARARACALRVLSAHKRERPRALARAHELRAVHLERSRLGLVERPRPQRPGRRRGLAGGPDRRAAVQHGAAPAARDE